MAKVFVILLYLIIPQILILRNIFKDFVAMSCLSNIYPLKSFEIAVITLGLPLLLSALLKGDNEPITKLTSVILQRTGLCTTT